MSSSKETELKITPVGTYTAICEEGSIGFGKATGMGFAKLKLRIEDAIPPGYLDTVWLFINAVEHAQFLSRMERFGIPEKPDRDNVKKLVGRRYVIRVTHRIYETNKMADVRLEEWLK